MKVIIFYLSEDDKKYAEVFRSCIQTKRDDVRCEVRSCSYLGFLKDYKFIFLCSVTREGQKKMRGIIKYNYNGQLNTTPCDCELTDFNLYKKYYPSNGFDDWVESLASKTTDLFFR